MGSCCTHTVYIKSRVSSPHNVQPKTLWFVQQYAEPSFHLPDFSSDEAGFARDSFINFSTTASGQRILLTVYASLYTSNSSAWIGIVADSLVGKHVFTLQLIGNHYHDLTLNGLPDLLEDIPLVVREWMSFMNDGASTYFSSAVRDVLSSTYHN
jgi:hypothetical protein